MRTGNFNIAQNADKAEIKSNEPKLVYGLNGNRKLIGYSHVTAQRIKNSGKLDGCYSQIGRKLIFDEVRVLKALQSKGGAK